MHMKTILNAVAPHKRFVYGKICWEDSQKRDRLLVHVAPRRNSKPVC